MEHQNPSFKCKSKVFYFQFLYSSIQVLRKFSGDRNAARDWGMMNKNVISRLRKSLNYEVALIISLLKKEQDSPEELKALFFFFLTLRTG